MKKKPIIVTSDMLHKIGACREWQEVCPIELSKNGIESAIMRVARRRGRHATAISLRQYRRGIRSNVQEFTQELIDIIDYDGAGNRYDEMGYSKRTWRMTAEAVAMTLVKKGLL